MRIQERLEGEARAIISMTAAVVLSVGLAACESAPQQMAQAVFQGDAAAMNEILKTGEPGINAPVTLDEAQPACNGHMTLTLLQAAACAGREAVVRRLLAAKAGVDVAAGAGQTPLVLAVANGHDAVARLLVAAGAGLENTDPAGNTPLILAAARGDRDLAAFLLKSGASPTARNKAGETALLRSANLDLAKMLMALGADPRVVSANGQSGLHLAAKAGNPQMATFFLEHGVDVALRDRNGMSALVLARVAAALANHRQLRETYEICRAGFKLAGTRYHRIPLSVTLPQFAEPGAAKGRTGLKITDCPAGGASVVNVEPGGAADRAGVRPGDIILGTDGRPAKNAAEIAAAINGAPAGSVLRLDLLRANLALANGHQEVIALIKDKIERMVEKEVSAADQAAQQGRSGEALGLYTAAVAKAADLGGAVEHALRLKIIRYAAALPQPPGIPEKAREHLVRSALLLKQGQDVQLVENEIVEALRLAPWWVDGYFNLGQIQAQEKKFVVAERNLRLFIEAAPTDPRARAAQDKIYEIRLVREEEGKIRSMQGRWLDGGGQGYWVSVNGDQIMIRSNGGITFTLSQKSGVLDGSVSGGSHPGDHGCTIPNQMHPVKGRLASNAHSMTLEYLWSEYRTSYHCVNMFGVPSNCCLTCDEVCDGATVSGTDQVTLQLRSAAAH